MGDVISNFDLHSTEYMPRGQRPEPLSVKLKALRAEGSVLRAESCMIPPSSWPGARRMIIDISHLIFELFLLIIKSVK